MSKRSLLKPAIPEPMHAGRMRALSVASGISDDALLNRLIALNVDPETLMALTLIPLIEVAWADGRLDAEERSVVLIAAKKCGFNRESYVLLKTWLECPPTDLIKAWEGNVVELLEKMSPGERTDFAADVLGRAKQVADATGGMLGFSRTSKVERKTLEEIERRLN